MTRATHQRVGVLGKRFGARLWPLYAFALALLVWARPTPVSLVSGGLLVLCGEGLRLWSTGYLHKNDALTVSGPYAFLRHPLYLGTLVIVSGFVLMGATLTCLALYAAFVVFFAVYYMPYKSRIEGARLEGLYGDAFRRYAVSVPSLIPRLHAYRPLSDEPAPQVSWRAERFADNHEFGTAVAVGVGILAMVGRWAFA